MKTVLFISAVFSLHAWSPWIYAAEPAQQSMQNDCNSGHVDGQMTATGMDLPQRSGSRIRTSGRVPHVQIGFEPVQEINDSLANKVFQLPGLVERPTIVSLSGARGMWLTEEMPLANPKAIVSGREFAHIHTDGSLHAPLPFERALELERKGWGERHPWADTRDGWEGLVMLYSATNEEELKILIQLVTESYNYVTGQSVPSPDC